METLLIDIDQCVAEFVIPFVRWANQRYDTDVPEKDPDRYYFFGDFGITNEDADRVLLDYYTEANGTIESIPGAIEAVQILSTFYDVRYCTARPHERRDQTMVWLAEKGILAPIIHSSARQGSKVDIVKEYGAIGIVEDNPYTASRVATAGYTCWLLDYPYNREVVEHSLIVRCYDWNHILVRLLAR